MSARSKAQPPRQDNYVKPVPAIAIAVLLLLGSFVRAQEADWSRFISLGDEAMAKRQYPQAEAAYREALKSRSNTGRGMLGLRAHLSSWLKPALLSQRKRMPRHLRIARLRRWERL